MATNDIRRQFRIPLRRRLYWGAVRAWRFVFGGFADLTSCLPSSARSRGVSGLWWVQCPGERLPDGLSLEADGYHCGCGQPQPCKHVRFLRRKGATKRLDKGMLA